MVVAIVIVVLLAGVITLIVAGTKKMKKQKSEMSSRGAVDYFNAGHVEGLPGVPANAYCTLIQFPNKLTIESGESKFEIPFERIRAAEVKTERELKQVDKSVVGRALVGTLLVPGLGTIVGGMSGIGSKNKKGQLNTFFILNYEDNRGELAAVTFLNNFSPIKINKFCDLINKTVVDRRGGEPTVL